MNNIVKTCWVIFLVSVVLLCPVEPLRIYISKKFVSIKRKHTNKKKKKKKKKTVKQKEKRSENIGNNYHSISCEPSVFNGDDNDDDDDDLTDNKKKWHKFRM